MLFEIQIKTISLFSMQWYATQFMMDLYMRVFCSHTLRLSLQQQQITHPHSKNSCVKISNFIKITESNTYKVMPVNKHMQ